MTGTDQDPYGEEALAEWALLLSEPAEPDGVLAGLPASSYALVSRVARLGPRTQDEAMTVLADERLSRLLARQWSRRPPSDAVRAAWGEDPYGRSLLSLAPPEVDAAPAAAPVHPMVARLLDALAALRPAEMGALSQARARGAIRQAHEAVARRDASMLEHVLPTFPPPALWVVGGLRGGTDDADEVSLEALIAELRDAAAHWGDEGS